METKRLHSAFLSDTSKIHAAEATTWQGIRGERVRTLCGIEASVWPGTWCGAEYGEHACKRCLRAARLEGKILGNSAPGT